MAGYGLKEAWIESGIIGPGAADAVLEGNKYKRGMRKLHKITVQALWHMILLDLVKFCEESNSNFHAQLMHHLTDCYSFGDFWDGNATLNDFITQRGEENVNFSYWWSYVEMVETLLQFTRAERDGIWYLHVPLTMLPYFIRYDHHSYGKWGTTYLTDMMQLPKPVLDEFQQGNFVVKRSQSSIRSTSTMDKNGWLGQGKLVEG